MKLIDCDGDAWIPDPVNPGAWILEKDDDGWFDNREILEIIWGPLIEVDE